MTFNRTCDGMNRRDMLRAGTLTLGGLTLAKYTRMAGGGWIVHEPNEQSSLNFQVVHPTWIRLT